MSDTTPTLLALLDSGNSGLMRQHGIRRDCWNATMKFLLASCLLACGFTLTASAQSPAGEAVSSATLEASANLPQDAAKNLVRWSGSLPEAAGRSVEMRFSLYQDQAGGLALWTETQTVKVGADGRYSVLLGIASAEGLPKSLFDGGAARWVEARMMTASGDTGGEGATLSRNLLAAVPYAFKAVDSEKLAGRAAAEYVTREDLQSAVATSMQIAPPSNTSSSPMLAGTGAAGALAYWSNSTTLADSAIWQSGAGNISITHSAAASASVGVGSPIFALTAKAFLTSGNGQPVGSEPASFGWQAVPVGNDTSTPGASLNLLYGFGAAAGAPTSTGLSIASNGKITFAPGQTFPGMVTSSASNTFTGTETFDGTYVALIANASAGEGISATGAETGVLATATDSNGVGVNGNGATGVWGTSTSGGVGVLGQATSSEYYGTGVQGNGGYEGVQGAGGLYGVYGSTSAYGTAGVMGVNGEQSSTSGYPFLCRGLGRYRREQYPRGGF